MDNREAILLWRFASYLVSLDQRDPVEGAWTRRKKKSFRHSPVVLTTG